MFWLGGLIALILIAVYLWIVRPVLKDSPMFSEAFKAEASIWQKLQAKITGWKTKIVARLLMIAGAAVGLYDAVTPYALGQDWSAVTAKMPAWSIPVSMVAIGALFHWLRNLTESPPLVIVQKDDTGTPAVIAVTPAK